MTIADWDRRELRGILASPLGGGEAGRPPAAFGKYRIVRELGRGAMGIVYEAEDSELKRAVALKVLRDGGDAREVLRGRFRREAEVTARLSHPNVVSVHDAGELDGRMYLVMELVEGRPFSEILGGRTLELRQALLILEKASRGAAAAHDAGIVHRDIKPANIIVDNDGEPKVTDFGLAHGMDSESMLTKSGTPMGTPMYMSPEQVAGTAEAISPATDVYALGAILYEILTGRPPHGGDTTMQLYGRIVNEEPAPPRRIDRRISADLQTICLKALEKPPSRRYPTAKEFADDLRRHREGHPILARPPDRLSRSVKWILRHRVLGASAAVAFAGLLGIGGLLGWKAQVKRREVAAFLASGRGERAELGRCREELRRLRAREEELAALPQQKGEEAARRRPLWEVQQQIVDSERKEAERSAAAILGLHSALALDSDCGEARRGLAELYFETFERAELRGDIGQMESARGMVLLYGDAALRDRTRPIGRLTIDSAPPGADFELFRFDEGEDRRLVPTACRISGPCPLRSRELAAGSYRVTLRRNGYRDVQVPVSIRRGEEHAATVNLYTDAEIGAGYVYIPAGRFIMGGDPGAGDAFEKRKDAVLDDYFIGRCEVTFGEYIEYLNDLVAAGLAEEVGRRLPQAPSKGTPLLTRPDGTYELRPENNPAWPVVYVDYEDAVAYAAWCGDRDRRLGKQTAYRVPTGAEYEKAARGVDGRFFPWGNTFHYSFVMTFGADHNPTMRPAGANPFDESPYGVLDLAGNVAEWTTNTEGTAEIRGNGWNSTFRSQYHAAFHVTILVDGKAVSYGFRLVRVPGRSH